jgi:hypothetical protein
VPLLRDQYWGRPRHGDALASAPARRPLLNPDHGVPEQSLFWTDPATGVPCRARIDWRTQLADGRTVVVDYKTTTPRTPTRWPENCRQLRLPHPGRLLPRRCQHARPRRRGHAVLPAHRQEKTPPYLASVRQLDAAAMRIGHADARRAREMWRDCTAAGTWPGYPVEVEFLSLPPWFENQHAEEYAA